MPEVVLNEAASRFEWKDHGLLAKLDFQKADNQIDLTHTEVPPEMEGEGVGGKLAAAGLEYARAAGLKVVPSCPFVAAYIKKHADYRDLVEN